MEFSYGHGLGDSWVRVCVKIVQIFFKPKDRDVQKQSRTTSCMRHMHWFDYFYYIMKYTMSF